MENRYDYPRYEIFVLGGLSCCTGLGYGLFKVAPKIIESAGVANEVGEIGIRVLSSYYGMGLGAGAALLGIIAVEKFLELGDRI